MIVILNCYNNKTSEPISRIFASFKENFMLPTVITQNEKKASVCLILEGRVTWGFLV